jgi:hypothetical protein
VFVGHEPHLPAALAAEVPAPSAVANLYPRRAPHDQAPATGAKDELARVEAFVSLLGNVPIFAAFKALLAEMTGDPQWESLCPPLVSMDRDARKAWLASVARTGLVKERDAA